MATDREIRLDLLARDKTGPATRSASENLDDVADSADDAAKATEKLGKETDKAAGRLSKLDHEIAGVNQNLLFLHEAMGDAADQAERLDISKGIRKAEADLKRLTKSRGILGDLLPDPGPAAKSFMTKLGSGLAEASAGLATKAGASVGPTIGIAVGAAAAPVLASTLAAALSAGAGAGVIGAGLALALKGDDKLADAGKKLGEKFMGALTKGIKGTGIAQPILQSFGVLDDAGERFVAKFTATLAKLSPAILPLVRDVVQGVERISDSVLKVAGDSGPALGALGDSFRLIADGVGDFIETVGGGGEEAAGTLRAIAGATADVVRWVGVQIRLMGDLADVLGGVPFALLKKHYKDAADESDNLAGSSTALARELTDGEKAARGQASALAGLSKELRAQTDPVFGLLNAQDKLAGAQEAYTSIVKKYGRNSEEAAKANRGLAEAALDLQGRVGQLGDTFNGRMTPALRATLRTAGLTEAQIANLERQFGQAKAAGDRFAKTYKATVDARTEDATARIRALEKRLRGIKDETVRINIITSERRIRKVEDQLGDMREYGGPVRAGKAYIVGEKRAEVFVPDQDGKIIPSVDAYARAGYAGSNMAGGSAQRQQSGGTLRLELSASSRSDSKVAELITYLIRNGDIRVDAVAG